MIWIQSKTNLLRMLGLILLFAGFIPEAFALNVQALRPNTGQTSGYQLFTSENLPKNHLEFGINTNLAHQPLERTPPNATNRIAGVVDQFVTADVLMSYGFTDFLSLGVDMPFNAYHNIAPTFIPTRDKGSGDIGDLQARIKLRVFDADSTASHLGLAFVPFVTAPTGKESLYFGDSSITGGVIAAGDWKIKSNRFYLNVGAKFREKETLDNGSLIVHHELLYGAGYERPLIKKIDLNVGAEVFGSTNFREFGKEDITSPLEGLVSFKKRWLKDKNFVTMAGVGVGITNGYALPVVRGTIGASYAVNMKKPRQVRERIEIGGKIHFEFDKDVIKPESYSLLDGVVEKLKAHPELSHIMIEGHTDYIGSNAYNKDLSDRRARALRQYLINKGIDPERISSVGYGEERPIADNTSDHGREINRRSEFYVDQRLD